MWIQLQGQLLERMDETQVLLVRWCPDRGQFMVSGLGVDWITPDDLANLARELMRAAVTKGSTVDDN